ncbi:TetR/AcrR family transcriptional regulator [Streptococcus merionis]|uniref:TetR/AcrR family transcriptional regulator n=1 Tax=Streptococcus merionis TaxID=400065 RepID=UPI00351715B5
MTTKDSYAKEQLKKGMLLLLEEKNFPDISISYLAQYSRTSRNSFYRNFTSKEDVIISMITERLLQWKNLSETKDYKPDNQRFTSLFDHFSSQRDFYLLLKKRQLFHLVLQSLLDLFGPKPEFDNVVAYATAFISYGTFGWIDEWVARGMQESAETMAELMAKNNLG